MHDDGADGFIQFPEESDENILHPLRLLAHQGQSWTIMMLESMVELKQAQDVTIFYECNQEFVQQPARIEELHDVEGNAECALTLIGTPVSAEHREHYRVDATLADRWMSIDSSDEPVQIVDVSATGCAIVCDQHYAVRDVIEATILYQEKEYCGHFCVQSVRALTPKNNRLGLYCVEDSNTRANPLIRVLRSLSMDLQRQQLRRLSRAA